MPTLDMKRLRVIADRPPADAVHALGGLARWWLSDAAVASARAEADPEIERLLGLETPPKLPDALGSCWVVCAVNGDFPLLRPAVVLPLRWVKSEPHSDALPKSLRALAGHVVTQVAGIKDLPAVGTWGLQPDPRLGLDRTPPADDLFRTWESGWASLTGGLIAAVLGLTPKPDVWASVAWRGGRLAPVEGLAVKMETAAALGATAFHVHWAQVNEAEGTAPAGLRVVPAGSPSAIREWDVIRTFVSAFVNEPPSPVADAADEAEQFDRCSDHYLTLVPFTPEAKRFYNSHLLDAITRRYRARITERYPTLNVRRYVTVVSDSPELASMGAEAVGAERVLLLHTGGGKKKDAETCAARLGVERCRVEQFGQPTSTDDFRRMISDFTADVRPDEVVLDLKPGTKKMGYALLSAARPGNLILNIEPEFRTDRRNTPGTELPELLPAISGHPPSPPA